MADFAELNNHEQQMLNIWLEYLTEASEGAFDELDEEPSFEEWLEDQVQFYSSDDEEEWPEHFAEPYRQALTEWQAEC